MTEKLIAFLQLFRHLPQEDKTLIAAAFKFKEFEEGDYLFKGGRVCLDFFFVCEGVLRIVADSEKGNEVTHYFINETHFCTILNSFKNGIPAQENIEAACKVKVLAISKTELLGLYTQLPYMEELINEITQRMLLEKIRVRNAYLGLDSANRYQQFISLQPDIARRVSLSSVASYLGITPQSLSRIRKNMY